MNFLKKCAAVLLTGAMVLSMSACSSDTDWIMRKGELEMPAGVYINNLLQSYYQASALVENTEEDVFKQQVEGTDAKEWIQQKALDETKRNMAACSEFNEHKLSLHRRSWKAAVSRQRLTMDKTARTWKRTASRRTPSSCCIRLLI